MRTQWLLDQTYFESTYLPKVLAANKAADPNFLTLETPEERRRAYYAQFNRLRDPIAVDEDGLATIEIVGPMMTGATPYEKLQGVSDYADMSGDIQQAAQDPAVKAVLLSIDSGGGMALGAPELADLVASLAQTKPVVAYTSSIMASAAYYAAAGATAIVASRSAIVGSIGTMLQVIDITAALEKFGVKIHTVTPALSDLKTTSHPTVPLTDAQRAALQDKVEATNAEFVGFVKSNRPAVEDASLRGQTFSGSQAVDAGLVDAVGSYAEARALALSLAARI